MDNADISNWLHHLEALQINKIKLGLDRINAVIKRDELNQFNIPIISITGTNGKGSTVAILSEIYRQAGYRCGCYTSPHINVFNERIQINGEMVSDEQLCLAFTAIEKLRGNIELTYFEFTTLAAFWLFQRADLDVLLLEIGLGGREDAVNTVDADVAVITSIDFDHMNFLGNERNQIAYAKAGIMRENQKVVCGDIDPPMAIYAEAEKKNARLTCVNKDFYYQEFESAWEFQNDYCQWSSLPIPSLPLPNAATALQVINQLQDRIPVSLWHITQGLQNVSLCGRMQALNQHNGYLDVAHNPQSARWLATRLSRLPCAGNTHAVFGIMQDKDIHNTILPLLPYVHTWHIAPFDDERSAKIEHLMNVFSQQGVQNVHNYATIGHAFRQASIQVNDQDRIIGFGSFHVVANILQLGV